MASPFSKVQFNAFEQLLTTDLNRLQNIASRELQELLRGTYGDGTLTSGQETPVGVSGFIVPPTLTFSAADTMTISAGSGFFNAPGIFFTDDSRYEVLRWPQQDLVFAPPDPTNGRIDIVLAEPAQVSSNSQTRNILTDPTTRTVVATPVFKNQDPVSNITVLSGTANANPVPPPVPSGKIALFEVFVAGGTVDHSTANVLPRMWRLAPNPTARINGIIRGCDLVWKAVSSFAPILATTTSTDNIVIIDGEVIAFRSFVSGLGNFPAGINDVLNPPTNGVAAAANPYYVYIVGGRHSPQATGIGTKVPVALVYSATPPDLATGHPIAAIQTPRLDSTITGAVYIGLGWLNSTGGHVACSTEGPWVYGRGNGILAVNGVLERIQVTGNLNGSPASKPMLSMPVVQQGGNKVGIAAYLNVGIVGAVAAERLITIQRLPDAVNQLSVFGSAGDRGAGAGIFFAAPNTGGNLIKISSDNTSSDTVDVDIIAYMHHAPRLDGGMGANDA